MGLLIFGILFYCDEGEYTEVQFLDSILLWRPLILPQGFIYAFSYTGDSIYLLDYETAGKVTFINRNAVSITFQGRKNSLETKQLSRIADNPEHLYPKELQEKTLGKTDEAAFLERAKRSGCPITEIDTVNRPNLGDLDITGNTLL
ncbi:MAG TPA: hypothetical protein DCG19_01445 [Cryomorphaceae bacterium]|nr:hypothetical protein [Owenweeksia sp.]HAD96034.1 hypothetical protein [Cryomorphaceae bacterium]HBF21940.1 hypothetical protein [Cryomorphaceae bacterium]|tara:strand:- start:51 stop:488 length:438 start_codon:yes stop_codon:yes gene_type:complete